MLRKRDENLMFLAFRFTAYKYFICNFFTPVYKYFLEIVHIYLESLFIVYAKRFIRRALHFLLIQPLVCGFK